MGVPVPQARQDRRPGGRAAGPRPAAYPQAINSDFHSRHCLTTLSERAGHPLRRGVRSRPPAVPSRRRVVACPGQAAPFRRRNQPPGAVWPMAATASRDLLDAQRSCHPGSSRMGRRPRCGISRGPGRCYGALVGEPAKWIIDDPSTRRDEIPAAKRAGRRHRAPNDDAAGFSRALAGEAAPHEAGALRCGRGAVGPHGRRRPARCRRCLSRDARHLGRGHRRAGRDAPSASTGAGPPDGT
jgi:hypothetical protein